MFGTLTLHPCVIFDQSWRPIFKWRVNPLCQQEQSNCRTGQLNVRAMKLAALRCSPLLSVAQTLHRFRPPASCSAQADSCLLTSVCAGIQRPPPFPSLTHHTHLPQTSRWVDMGPPAVQPPRIHRTNLGQNKVLYRFFLQWSPGVNARGTKKPLKKRKT